MNINIRESNLNDIEYISRNLRKEDIVELETTHGDVKNGLMACYESKLCMTYEIDEKPIFIFGLEPSGIITDSACVFLVGTKDIEKYPKEFLKFTKRAIKEALKDYSILYNFVDFRYNKSIRWLEKIGAKFISDVNINGHRFLYFEFRRNK